MRGGFGWGLVSLALGLGQALASEPGPSKSPPSRAEAGRLAVRRPLNPPFWSLLAYQNAWRLWGIPARPADYDHAFRERYGLHRAPDDNGGLPMGFTRPKGLLGIGQGLGNDCLLCHAGSVAGQTIIGLGNASLDMQSLYEELSAADGLGPVMPLTLCNTRGTSEASNFAVYLMQFREPDLHYRLPPIKFALCETLCEDIPAWWHFKRKRTIYHLGLADSRSVRTLMPFLLVPGNSAEYIKGRESEFADIRAYLLSLQPPRYPFRIDGSLAARGKQEFEQRCARCHGTYGAEAEYPNKVVPLDVVGTDKTLARAFAPQGVTHYLRSWFAREYGPAGESYHGLGGRGYQAPPLDGVWATAPYLHNGSVPTLEAVLNSQNRPRIFTRSFRGGEDDYDSRAVGVRFTIVAQSPTDHLPGIERRRIYDTTQPGRGNQGHTFGDALSRSQREAIIEYLKTL
jgi:mono/diheme cytochrome c family protein